MIATVSDTEPERKQPPIITADGIACPKCGCRCYKRSTLKTVRYVYCGNKECGYSATLLRRPFADG